MAVAPPSGNAPQLRIPKLNTDLVWSLRPWPTLLSLGGQEFQVPALSAADWIPAILDMQEDTLSLLTALLAEEDMERLTDLMFTGSVESEDLFTLCTDLLTTVGARPWWITVRLITVAQQHWDTLGAEMMLKGIDAATLSLSGWLDVFLLVLLRMMDPKEVTMFTMKLEMVPPEFADKIPEEELEISRDAFLSMAG